MATVTLEAGVGYWLENDKIKFRVKKDGVIVDRINVKAIPRDVMYFLTCFQYRTDGGVLREFYLSNISDWTLTPSPSPAETVWVKAEKTYVDAGGVSHNFVIVISLKDGENRAKYAFKDVASHRLNQVGVFQEANVFPQGYTAQGNGGNVNAGGNTDYTVPLPYDNLIYIFVANGKIFRDSTVLAENKLIDNYIVCYSTDASVGFYGNYVDLRKLRVRSLNSGLERQWIWFDLNPRTIHDFQHEVTFYFGAWNAGSAAPIRSEYNALPLVETLLPMEERMFTRNVRTDLNYFLYQYNGKFEEIIANLKSHSAKEPGNATLVPAGTVSWKFFKHRGKPATWNNAVVDTGEDYVQKSVDMCRADNIRLFVEVDVLDPVWTAANPMDGAIGLDEANPHETYCPELHSHQYVPSRPREALQNNEGPGTNVVVELPSGSFNRVNWKVNGHVRIADNNGHEDRIIVAVNKAGNTITIDTVSRTYYAAAGGYVLPLWYITTDGESTWFTCPSCGGDGKLVYWIKLMRLITPGAAYHDAFVEYVKYLCQNYNFYGLVISECFYRDVDYSSEAKTQFISDTGRTDWPRNPDNSINVYDETLGNWKTSKLCQLFMELKAIANANNKKFFVMVQPNFWNPERMAREFGQYWPTIIKCCDGLWVWGYYGFYDLPPKDLRKPIVKLKQLQTLYPEKECILSIGLWDAPPNQQNAITPTELYEGLCTAKSKGWFGLFQTGWGIEVTPSKLMTDAHWNVLWGDLTFTPDYKLGTQEDLIEIRAHLGAVDETSSFEALLPNFNGQYNNAFLLEDLVEVCIGKTSPPPAVLIGVIEEIIHESTPMENYIRLRGRCLGELLLRKLVTKIYEHKKGEEIVKDLIDNYVGLSHVRGATELIENTDTTYTKLEYEDTPVFDILKFIAKSADKAGVIGFDFRVAPDGKFEFFPRNSKTSTVNLSEKLEVSQYRRSISRKRDKIYVYGAEEKKLPLDGDAWTETLNGWNDPATLYLDSDRRVGQYSIRRTKHGTVNAYIRTFPKISAGSFAQQFKKLSFYVKVNANANMLILLYAPDENNCFRLFHEFPKVGEWTFYDIPIGPEAQAAGHWFTTGSPSWDNIQGIKISLGFYTIAEHTSRLDGLHFGRARYSATYGTGVRELAETDEELHSDAECLLRAKALHDHLSAPAEYIKIESDLIDYGLNPILAGDRIWVNLPNENVNGYYRVISAEYRLIAETQTLETTLELGKEPPLLADYLYALKSKTGSLARYKIGRVY